MEVFVVSVNINCELVQKSEANLYTICNGKNYSENAFLELNNFNQTNITSILSSKFVDLYIRIGNAYDLKKLSYQFVSDTNETKRVYFVGEFSKTGTITYYTIDNFEKKMSKKISSSMIQTFDVGHVPYDMFDINPQQHKNYNIDVLATSMDVRRKYIKDKIFTKMYKVDTAVSVTKNDFNSDSLETYVTQSNQIGPESIGFSYGIWAFVITTMTIATIVIVLILCQRLCDAKILTFRMLPSIAGNKLEEEYANLKKNGF